MSTAAATAAVAVAATTVATTVAAITIDVVAAVAAAGEAAVAAAVAAATLPHKDIPDLPSGTGKNLEKVPPAMSNSLPRAFISWGCDVINMTTVPEVCLAMEAGISYASVAMVTT